MWRGSKSYRGPKLECSKSGMDAAPFCLLLLPCPLTITEGFPAPEVTCSASCSTAFLRPTLLTNDRSLFSVSSCYWLCNILWWSIFNKLAQQLQRTVRKQKIVICSCKELEALWWSCCPDLNSLLQRQNPASYKGLWFYFFHALIMTSFCKVPSGFVHS